MKKTKGQSKRPRAVAVYQPARKFLYRFLLSFCLCLLILLSLVFDASNVGVFILLFINVAFCADLFLWAAYKDLTSARYSFAVLVSTSVLAGFLYCAFHTFLTRPLAGPQINLYAYVSFLLTISLWIQQRMTQSHERINVFLKKIDDFLPKSARLYEQGKKRMVFVNELQVGDWVWVQPGERIPCDGVLRQGNTTIDEQLISGNILPTVKQVGSSVYAGTLNKQQAIGVEVTAPLACSALMSVLDAIKSHEKQHRSKVCFLERFSPLLGALLWIAAGGIYGYVLTSHAGQDWFYYSGIFWLILALGCPIAWFFVLVFPPFFVKRGAKHLGVILNQLDSLQTFVLSDTLFFDKTGTLTQGNLEISGIFPARADDKKKLLTALVCAEQNVDSPFASAIQQAAKVHQIEPEAIKSQEVVPGQGVQAKTEAETILAGRAGWLEEQGVKVPSVQTRGQTVIFVACNQQYLGYVTLADQLREGAREVIALLQQKGKEIFLISGDTAESVQQIADQVGIEKTSANVLPKTKAEIINNLRALGKRVVMVGDGFNDIIALLKADGGIVFSSYKNVYNHWVDIVIKRPDLFVLADLFKIDKRLRLNSWSSSILAILVQGLFVASVFYKPQWWTHWQALLGVVLGAILLVLLNSMRLLKIK